MKLLDFPVRNWQFTVIVFAMLAALGVSSWLAIPRGEDPPLKLPTFIVIAVYPGASPADLERLVVRDVEKRLDALDNVKKIESKIQDGVATTQVEFNVGEDPDDRYEEVLREMNGLRPELPADLARFTVEKFTTLDVAIATRRTGRRAVGRARAAGGRGARSRSALAARPPAEPRAPGDQR